MPKVRCVWVGIEVHLNNQRLQLVALLQRPLEPCHAIPDDLIDVQVDLTWPVAAVEVGEIFVLLLSRSEMANMANAMVRLRNTSMSGTAALTTRTWLTTLDPQPYWFAYFG